VILGGGGGGGGGGGLGFDYVVCNFVQLWWKSFLHTFPSLKVKLDYIISQKSYDSGGRDQMQVVPLYIIIYLLKSQNLIAYYKV
jgi:hypothetical protein